jgi:DNA-binding transcriptional LysR family regulator
MLDADDLRFFAAVAASDTLAAAARALDVSAPAVTQRLRALETRLGVQLVERGGRHLVLTGEGELLAERGRDITGALGELTEALAARRGAVAGELQVLAPFGFGRRHVAPLVAAFQAAYPEVRITLRLTDRIGRAAADTEAWDVAIHVGALDEAAAGLGVRHLAPNERFLCAAPEYLARRGVPRSPGDLHRHACIALRENDEDVTLWRFRRGAAEERVRIRPMLASNDGEVAKLWALAGHGLIIRSEWDVADDLRDGRLLRLLPDYTLPPAPVVALVGTRREARAGRTRRFLDHLVDGFSQPSWRRPLHT